MGDTSESPKIGLCTMLGLSLLCTIDYFLYMASVFSWLTLPDTQLLGWLGLLHIVVYGASSSFVPRADTTMGTDRQTRMANQGGHTLMWTYFAGLGPLAETLQIARQSPAGAPQKVLAALVMHATGLSGPKALFHFFALRWLAPLIVESHANDSLHSVHLGGLSESLDSSGILSTDELGAPYLSTALSADGVAFTMSLTCISLIAGIIASLVCLTISAALGSTQKGKSQRRTKDRSDGNEGTPILANQMPRSINNGTDKQLDGSIRQRSSHQGT